MNKTVVVLAFVSIILFGCVQQPQVQKVFVCSGGAEVSDKSLCPSIVATPTPTPVTDLWSPADCENYLGNCLAKRASEWKPNATTVSFEKLTLDFQALLSKYAKQQITLSRYDNITYTTIDPLKTQNTSIIYVIATVKVLPFLHEFAYNEQVTKYMGREFMQMTNEADCTGFPYHSSTFQIPCDSSHYELYADFIINNNAPDAFDRFAFINDLIAMCPA